MGFGFELIATDGEGYVRTRREMKGNAGMCRGFRL